jgi:aminocarboxymuconate-semialdehyde decarboxylase
MVIDFHAHVINAGHMEALQAHYGLQPVVTDDGKTLWRHNGYTLAWSRPDMYDVDARLRDMDRKGIDIRVVSPPPPFAYPWKGVDEVQMTRRLNDGVADLCHRHPDRFIGLASLPFDDMTACLDELERARSELGLKGVAIGSGVDQQPLNHPRYDPLWARLDALAFPVFEHPVVPLDQADMGEFELPLRVGMIFETTLVATRLIYGGIFERYPNFPYVLAHTGGALLIMLERLDNGYRLFPDCRKYINRPPSDYARRLYYDTCAFGSKTLMLARDIVGVDRLLFGTDDPYLDVDTRHVRQLPLPEAEMADILGGNAARILGLT